MYWPRQNWLFRPSAVIVRATCQACFSHASKPPALVGFAQPVKGVAATVIQSANQEIENQLSPMLACFKAYLNASRKLSMSPARLTKSLSHKSPHGRQVSENTLEVLVSSRPRGSNDRLERFQVVRWLAECGNGVVEGLEECDVGNTIGGNGCSSDCKVESGYDCTDTQPSVCHLLAPGQTPRPRPPPPAPRCACAATPKPHPV